MVKVLDLGYLSNFAIILKKNKIQAPQRPGGASHELPFLAAWVLVLEAVTLGHLAEGSSSPPGGRQEKRDKDILKELTWPLGSNQSSKDLVN